MKKPNIFEFATSELTQDAVIAWLLNWAKKENAEIDEGLYQTGQYLIRSLFEKQGINISEDEINDLEIKLQYHKIDLFFTCTVGNKDYAVIIEDKVYSSEHSIQLERYSKLISDKYSNHNLLLIYFKTGFQADFAAVSDSKFNVFDVSDFSQVFEYGSSINVRSDIFQSYSSYLESLVSQYKSDKYDFHNYHQRPIKDWNWWGWIGFMSNNKEGLKAHWHVVKNRRGPVLSLWFDFKGIEVKSVQRPFEPYIYVTYSHKRQKTQLGYRIRLKDVPMLTSEDRQPIMDEYRRIIDRSNLNVKTPKFKKAKVTIELLTLDESNGDWNEQALIDKLTEMKNIF